MLHLKTENICATFSTTSNDNNVNNNTNNIDYNNNKKETSKYILINTNVFNLNSFV